MKTSAKLISYLLRLGLDHERARQAAATVLPLLDRYFAARRECRHVPGALRFVGQNRRPRPSPFPEVDAELALTADPPELRYMDAPPDGDAFFALASLGITGVRHILLSCGAKLPHGIPFQRLASRPLVTNGGLRRYLYDPRRRAGSLDDRWLKQFIATTGNQPLCHDCFGRWVDPLAEDHVRFLAAADDETALGLEPYLTLLAPYVRGIMVTDSGDAIFEPR